MKRYHIAEVIKILGVCKKTLYLWEQKKKIPKARRNPTSNYRYWTEQDLKKLKKITGR